MRTLLVLLVILLIAPFAGAQDTPTPNNARSEIPALTVVAALIFCGAALYAVCFPARRETTDE
jgi:hypothetical protein